MRSFIHKANLDERHKSHVATVFPAHPSKLIRPVFLNDILSPSAISNGMTPLAIRPRSPNVLFNVPTSSTRDLSDDERDSGRPKRRGGVVKLKKLNDKIKFSKAMRRRSCCCKWCGGISEFEAKHQDIVGNVERVVKARTVLAAADFFSENTSVASSARDALREVLPEATILRQKNQKKARDKYIAHRKMISGLDGLKAGGKSSFSHSFNAKSSNRRSIGSQESLTQGLDDSDSGSGLKIHPDLDKLEEEEPGEAESPQENPYYPAEFPSKRNLSRSTTEPNLFKRRSKLPGVNAKRGSDLPRPSQLRVDLGEPPSAALTQGNLEVSPIFKNMKAVGESRSRSSTPLLKSPSPQILKVANIVQKNKGGLAKSLPFSPANSRGFIQKGTIKTRSKVTSIKLEVGKDGKNISVYSLVKVPPLSKTPTAAENHKGWRTSSSIQLKTEGAEEGGMTRTLEFLVPPTAVVSPKESRVHSSNAMTSTPYKSLSKMLKKSQERAINVYTKDKLLIQEKKVNLKYQSHSNIQRGNQKSLSHFPGVQVPKLNVIESRMTSPQRKAQTLIPIKFKDEKGRVKANDKKATWLVGNFGGPKKNFIMKSFCLDQTSLAELKINKKRRENIHGI